MYNNIWLYNNNNQKKKEEVEEKKEKYRAIVSCKRSVSVSPVPWLPIFIYAFFLA